MVKLIKNHQVIDDDWQWLLDGCERIPDGPIVISLSLWESRNRDFKHCKHLGLYLDSDQPPELIADSLACFALIAINFPQLTDGRGFSYARALREQYDFKGELRAVGNFVVDQLFYLQRCGFDTFSFTDDATAQQALCYLRPFTYTYQSMLSEGKPLLATKRLS